MMAPSHSIMGATAGLGLVAILNLDPILAILAVFICAGAALLPDCDQPSSTFGHSLGFVTRWTSKILYRISSAIYIATRTSEDPAGKSGHRKITHTIIYNLILAIPVFALSYTIIGQAVAIGFLVILALRGSLAEGLNVYFPIDLNGRKKSKRLLKVEQGFAIMAGLSISSLIITEGIQYSPWHLTLLIVLGSLMHLIGDCCTPAGVPLLWPLPISGKIWYKVKLPITFDAGKKIEKNIITPLLFAIFLIVGFYTLM